MKVLERRLLVLERRRGVADQSEQLDLSWLTDEQLDVLAQLTRDDQEAAEVYWAGLLNSRRDSVHEASAIFPSEINITVATCS